VISAKKKALTQLQQDISSTKELVSRYQAFVTGPINVLGGNPAGAGGQDGDNAKIILDALPSKYDFPALVTSLEKIFKDQGVQIESIGGTDDQIAQADSSSSTPQPVPVPFQFSVSGNYDEIKKVVTALERSIRPMQIQTMQLTGNEKKMTLTVSAQTYYQPEKNLKIRTEVVR
jgi:Tfp pilus assembly protein PilO